MLSFGLFFALLILHPVPDRPIVPAWSPDHEVLATTKVPQAFVTPEGGNYRLLLNGKVVYPHKKKRIWFTTYEDQHTFLSPLEWAPDSQHLAFVEKVYDWEYIDPYNRDFTGRVSNLRFYLVVVSREGEVSSYPLGPVPQELDLHWTGEDQLTLNRRHFDIQTHRELL